MASLIKCLIALAIILIPPIGVLSCKSPIEQHYDTIANKNDTIEVELPANLGSGYQWHLFDSTVMRIVDHSVKATTDSALSEETEVFKLKSIKRGVFHLRFYFLRPLEKPFDTTIAKKADKIIKVK